MVAMQGETARRIISEQERIVRELLWKELRKRGAEAERLAKSLARWEESKTFFGSRPKPGVLRQIDTAHQWLMTNNPLPYGISYHLQDRVISCATDLEATSWQDAPSDCTALREGYIQGIGFPENPYHRRVYSWLGNFASATLEDPLSYSAHPLISAPVEAPPRHGRLNQGMLARLVIEDVKEQIDAGRALEGSLNEKPLRVVWSWCSETRGVLRAFADDVPSDFWRLVRDVGVCRSPAFPDPAALSQAYLSLGLSYLEEVLERMPDYAEASGQAAPEPRVSFAISGGTFHGVQFATQIANIESTIAGVAYQSGTDAAEALKALQQAVLSQPGLEDSERQDLLDNVEYLATAANTPHEHRKRGLISAALLALTTAAAAGGQLQGVMDTWGGVLQGLLP
ncbi:hypothetical protein B7755_028830 [Streptomyces sp. NBS 14/10]|uniref:hypothetical protein n=1 Tax=Streptomyces sp. NBS 14/10 TaxID=1945643 RepID=UPI00117EC843|nr:hypothetical protein [Streptomyces sp. NBS 14/10]KAK1181797.1 hypothetical protein B7755_028830 [Streptomyces sp. NBS 14/10]